MFKIGDEVSYGIHGRCQVMGIETKTISGSPVHFYQIRAVNFSPIPNKNARPSPNILVPVESAAACGLRTPLDREGVATVLRMLEDQEYYFTLQEPWTSKQKRLEEALRKEGATGLAKAVGHLHVLLQQDAAPRPEVSRYFEQVLRLLVREMAEITATPAKEVEHKVRRALKSKSRADV